MIKRKARRGDSKMAVAYVRVSTDDQRLGQDAQRASIEAWARREGVVIVAWHCDQGVSGGSDVDERPALAAALGELRPTEAGILVVARRDRLARDVAIAAAIERAADACGASVASAEGVSNGDSPAEQFLRTILDAAAAYERSLIRARTKAALAAKKARGERAGQVPYGFVAEAGGRLVPCHVEQEVLADVRSLRAGGKSLRRIVAELAAAGRVSRTGRPFALTQVANMVRAAA